MFIKYNVKTEEFAEKHYIKNFRKKYKTYWDLTFKGIEKMLEGLDSIMDTTIVEEIKILLVYHKSDIGDKNETATWKKIIRNNYSDYDFCK